MDKETKGLIPHIVDKAGGKRHFLTPLHTLGGNVNGNTICCNLTISTTFFNSHILLPRYAIPRYLAFSHLIKITDVQQYSG